MSHRVVIIKTAAAPPSGLTAEEETGITSEVAYPVPHDQTPEQTGHEVCKLLKKINKLQGGDAGA